MPSVTIIQPDGARAVIDVPAGTPLMQALVREGIDGIVAECGGSAMCATCHVYVAEDQCERLPPMDAVEDEMLHSTVSERLPNSRLSCQLVMTPELDGLVVTIPDRQT